MVTPKSLTGTDGVQGEDVSSRAANALAAQRPYAGLDARRRARFCCTGLTNPSRFRGGTFDIDPIWPSTLWQGNFGAICMVVGQDWGEINYFLDNRGREASDNPTNTTLRNLLAIAGLRIDPPSVGKSPESAMFFTNAILCLKQGSLQAAGDPAWFEDRGTHFLKPTIDLLAPRIVITLGERAYRAARSAYSLRLQAFRRAVEGAPTQLPSGTLLVSTIAEPGY